MTPKKTSATRQTKLARQVSPGRPPKAEVPALLRRILSVAADEFINQGYATANVARIARDAGVSKKTIYLRYPTKEALLVAVVTDLVERSHDAIIGAMSSSDGDPEHMLTNFGVQAARNWAGPEEIGLYRLIISEAPRFPELASLYCDSMDHFRVALADYLRQQNELGTLAVPDAPAAAHQFGMLVYGDIREKVLLGETVTDKDITSVVQRAVHVFLGGYTSASSQSGRRNTRRNNTTVVRSARRKNESKVDSPSSRRNRTRA